MKEDRFAQNIAVIKRELPKGVKNMIVPDRIMLCRFAQMMILPERLEWVTDDPRQLPESDALHLRMRNLMAVASDAEVLKIFRYYLVLNARRKIKKE